MPDAQYQQRYEAALASKGTSCGAIYRLVLKLCTSLQIRGDVLDYGAGTGNLLGQIHECMQTGSLTGADILPRPEALPESIRWVAGDLNSPLLLPDASFDTIISAEVIEHLENPRAVYREFFRLLRPGGNLIVTTPNQESLRSLAALGVGGHFVAFADSAYPAHITALLRKDFQRICLECRFEPPVFAYTDEGGIPKLPHILWQSILSAFKGRWFSDNIAIVTRKPVA